MITRGICFDLDGTLIDSGKIGLERIIKIAGVRNLPVTAEIEQRIRNVWGMPPLELLRLIWPNEDPRAFFTEWENLDIAEPLETFFGTKEALRKLSRHFYLSILTNRQFRTIPSQLARNEIERFFGLIATPEDSGYKKPDPRSMEPILRRYDFVGIERKNIILVGDTVEGDWKLAQALGLEFYAVISGGMDSRDKFISEGVLADRILNSVADLPPILIN